MGIRGQVVSYVEIKKDIPKYKLESILIDSRDLKYNNINLK